MTVIALAPDGPLLAPDDPMLRPDGIYSVTPGPVEEWSFIQRYGVTLAAAAMQVSATERLDVVAALASGGGRITTTNEGLARRLRELRINGATALQEEN